MALSEERLALAHEDARVAFSGVELPFDVFARWVRERVDATPDADEETSSDATLFVSDLYLACACAHDIPGAIARLLADHRPALDGVARRIGLSDDSRDELVQLLCERLFVAAEDGSPKIARYSGTGPLRGWLKAVATRIALDLVRRAPRDKPTDETLSSMNEGLVARLVDAPDARFEKESDRQHVRLALREAFQALPAQDRNLLRYALLDGLGIDELARIYQIHRATAARRLVSARDSLADGVRAWLRSNLAIDEAACANLLREGLSQVDLTLRTKVTSSSS